jgi:ABC-type multidrug transport system fused ATPase/permease subunit
VSSVDAEGARALHDAIVRAPADRPRTTLVIAHRVSTIAAADRVVLLDDGRVLATGSHRSLLDSCPAYRELLAGQVAAR